MRKIVILICAILPFFAAVSQEGPKDLCKVTYVANEGFLIATKTNKVIVDAIFGGIKGNWCDQPPDSVSNLVLRGEPPFDKIDVVLITHRHADHFKAGAVIDFLKNNGESVVICPGQAVELMKRDPGYAAISGRIRTLNSPTLRDTAFLVNNVKITAMRFNHGSYLITDTVTGKSRDIHTDVENFVYLIEADRFSVLHTGDGSSSNKKTFEDFGFRTKQFDIAFIDRSFLGRDGQEIMNECIRAKKIVFMHAEPDRKDYYKSVIKNFPELFIFTRPMEEMVYRKEM